MIASKKDLMLRFFVIPSFLLLLSGCNSDPEIKDGSGTLRYEIFRECMRLAAALQSPKESLSTTESEVDDVVDECSNEAYYMANNIKNNG